MPRTQATVFVLWADNFDEVAAVIFVTELRKAGLRVKVVGLTPRRLSGAYGLTLAPDLTLDQALSLAERAICLIVPQDAQSIQYLNNDPRLQQLFELVAKNQGWFVIGSLNRVTVDEFRLFTFTSIGELLFYPSGVDTLEFAHNLAVRLIER